jgi:1-acyl-sn-glycerol-3-phosphate acyltransferase
MSPPAADAPTLPRSLRTPLPIRLWRYLRVTVHVFGGVAETLFLFPLLNVPQRRARVQLWCRRLLAMMNVRRKLHGLRPGDLPGDLLIVANHVSWLDIFVIDSVHPARFVGKSELKKWPLVGHMTRGCGTLFIERERRHDTARVNKTISDVLRSGDCIAIFPEGTTSDGQRLMHFHGSLLQPVIDAGGHIAPMAIRYCNVLGERSDSPAYVGETTFLQSFWRVLGERELIVEITVLPLLATQVGHRRELSRDAHHAIARVLAVPSEHKHVPVNRPSR